MKLIIQTPMKDLTWRTLGNTLRYQTPLLMRAADGSRTHVPGLEGEYNSRYTTAALFCMRLKLIRELQHHIKIDKIYVIDMILNCAFVGVEPHILTPINYTLS